ncbi:hypothetical protein HK107_09730 [Parvularcula sp. ZS-1/3]|uniref:Uncharacterized protein n=1 Tax=Parvularcula mediterranea TaxID=2732508 RepID=A0A7Y3W5G6_9PROT|nr:hypothetical protein [Parvularcula mediterranea]NNU16599.1 hypothetical protein [Parvularcula mediterranea]
MLGELGAAFSFDRYADEIMRQTMLDPAGMQTVEFGVLGALGLGALASFALMIIRRSGTAAAGFALLVLTALSQAMLFGILDFVTGSTQILIGALTASALLLFVNAVLHTGRENILIAGLSAIIILGTLGLAGANAAGMDFAEEARLAMAGATAVSAILLIYAMVRDPAGKAFLGLTIILALAASFLMSDPIFPVMRSMMPVIFPSVLIAAGMLLATLTAPFFADEMRMPSRAERRAAAEPVAMPASLFGDDDSLPQHSGISRHRPQEREDFTPPSVTSYREEQPEPAPRQDGARDADRFDGVAAAAATAAAFTAAAAKDGDPVSSYWHDDHTAIIEAEAEEYVWDVLANPEVRLGEDVLRAFGGMSPEEMTPEGLRERLSPESLAAFDDEVLGGGEPVSGTFETRLETHGAIFTFRGRRKVDHDGILMRIDAEVTEVEAKAQPTAALAAPASTAEPLSPQVKPAATLSGGGVSGVVVDLNGVSKPEDVRLLIDDAGRALAGLMASGVKRPFALIDSTSGRVRPGVLAAAVGKASRVHELPRNAMVVTLPVPTPREMKGFKAAAEDIRTAGGGVGLTIESLKDKLPKKFEADMLLVSAVDVLHPKKRGRKSAIEALLRKVEAPVLVRDLGDEGDADHASEDGARFGSGRAFAGLAIPLAGAAPEEEAGSGIAPLNHPGGAVSAMRANGLR